VFDQAESSSGGIESREGYGGSAGRCGRMTRAVEGVRRQIASVMESRCVVRVKEKARERGRDRGRGRGQRGAVGA
jgi:hypothetical protein